MSLKKLRVLVLGLGISGRSAVQFLLDRHVRVVGFDKNTELLLEDPVRMLCWLGMIFLSDESKIDVAAFDLLVVSPGIPPSHPLYSRAIELGIEVIGETELACREIQKKCLAVTGTNGKTTVTLLTTQFLQQQGIKARALGNIGVPLTSVIDAADNEETEVLVIELSSFQLETLSTRFIDAGVLLNITPDHLDRYPSMEAYAAVKVGMEKNIKERGTFFVEDKCFKEFGHLFSNQDVQRYGYESDLSLFTDTQDVYLNNKKLFSLPEMYQGKHLHEIENIMASCALCSTLSIQLENFLIAFASFQKPSHRIEFVRKVNGVNYYDDSKGTNIDAVIRAVEVLEGKIILIAGGVDKGFPYTPWIKAFAGKVKAICAIGESKEKIQADLGKSIPVIPFLGMEDAVSYATSSAKAGENVLLSPGCSSFDMFNDYTHRGQEFQRLIHALKENY